MIGTRVKFNLVIDFLNDRFHLYLKCTILMH